MSRRPRRDTIALLAAALGLPEAERVSFEAAASGSAERQTAAQTDSSMLLTEKARAQLGPAAFEAAWAEGQHLTMEQALALAAEGESADEAVAEALGENESGAS